MFWERVCALRRAAGAFRLPLHPSDCMLVSYFLAFRRVPCLRTRAGAFRLPLHSSVCIFASSLFCWAGFRVCGCGEYVPCGAQQGLSARPCILRSRLRIRRSAREGNRTRSTGKSSAATAHRMTGTDTGHTRGSATDNPVSSFVRPLARSACLPSGDRGKCLPKMRLLQRRCRLALYFQPSFCVFSTSLFL